MNRYWTRRAYLIPQDIPMQVAAESELAQMFRRDLAEGSAARAEVIARFRRLEADLAKCRTYFGAKAFDEATKAAP